MLPRVLYYYDGVLHFVLNQCGHYSYTDRTIVQSANTRLNNHQERYHHEPTMHQITTLRFVLTRPRRGEDHSLEPQETLDFCGRAAAAGTHDPWRA